MRIFRFFLLVCLAALMGESARAALLNLAPQEGAPDLTASFISVNYTASDKSFVASGFSDTYYPNWGNGSAETQLGAGTWKLTATLGLLAGARMALRASPADETRLRSAD